MPDYTVNSHIDAFLKTDTPSAARSSLEVPRTSDFQSLCSTVQATSASWNNTYTTVQATSSKWNNTTSVVQANSASWVSGVSGVSSTLINFISGFTYTISVSDAGLYVRKYHDTTHFVIIPVFTPSNILRTGSSITVRNAGLSSLTLSANNINTILHYDLSYSANIIDPKNTTQIIYLGDNTWDII